MLLLRLFLGGIAGEAAVNLLLIGNLASSVLFKRDIQFSIHAMRFTKPCACRLLACARGVYIPVKRELCLFCFFIVSLYLVVQ